MADIKSESLAGLKSESVAGFVSELPAGFVGIRTNRKEKLCFSPFLYRDRNAVERMFCRLKDFRRIATRYDRNAANFLAAVSLAAAVSYWL